MVVSQLEAILTCYALNVGRSWWTVSSQLAALASFYLTTWEEYHTGASSAQAWQSAWLDNHARTIIPGPSVWPRGRDTLDRGRLHHDRNIR